MMPDYETEPIQGFVKTRHLNVTAVFDPEFLGLIRQELPTAEVQHFCLQVIYKDEKGETNSETVTIGHPTKSDTDEGRLLIDSARPITYSAALRALSTFYEKRKTGGGSP